LGLWAMVRQELDCLRRAPVDLGCRPPFYFP
jgi:hypothetical protein